MARPLTPTASRNRNGIVRLADREAFAPDGLVAGRHRPDIVQRVGDYTTAGVGKAERLQDEIFADRRALYETHFRRVCVDQQRVLLQRTVIR